MDFRAFIAALYGDEAGSAGDVVEHRFTDTGHVRIVNDGELVQLNPRDTIAQARDTFARAAQREK